MDLGTKGSSLVLFSLPVILVIYESLKERAVSVERVSHAKIKTK
jgi:hypothetical protein